MRYGAFPNAFPEGSVQNLTRFLQGGGDRWVAIESAYDLLGYALYNIRGPVLTNTPQVSMGVGIPTYDMVAAELDKICSRVRNEGGKTVAMPEAKEGEAKEGEAKEGEAKEGEAKEKNETLVSSVVPVTLPGWFIAFLLQFLTKNLTS